MESLSSNLSVSNASATGSGRSKVALKPGHSLMDWIRYTHSGKDLTSTGGKILEVSSRELAKHNTKKDAWIALKGKVYNITPYLDYHPGGEEELMRGAGKDATDLFNQVHRWVNAESMLQKCFVGVLKKSWSLDVPRFPTVNPLKKQKTPKIIPKVTSTISPVIEKKTLASNGVSNGVSTLASNGVSTLASNGVSNGVSTLPSNEWYTVSATNSVYGETSIRLSNEVGKLKFKVTSTKLRPMEIITDLIKENLYIKFNKESHTWLNIKFPKMIESKYEVEVTGRKTENDSIELIFDDNEVSDSSCSKSDTVWTLCDKGDKSRFWPCKLVQKSAVNYNTYLFTFLLPSNVKMWIPIGWHVSLKFDIEGMEVVKRYTPIISLNTDKESDESDGCHIVLMIKIYPSGTLTPLLNMCSLGESVLVSSYDGSFSESVLKNCDSIVMLAAGTGITPMIRIIFWALTAKDKTSFQVVHILSESNHKWDGYTGSISKDILNKLLPANTSSSQQILICGPLGFTDTALRLLDEMGYNQDYIYAFKG